MTRTPQIFAGPNGERIACSAQTCHPRRGMDCPQMKRHPQFIGLCKIWHGELYPRANLPGKLTTLLRDPACRAWQRSVR